MRTSNVALLAEIDILELRIGIDANELEVVNELDRMTDEIAELREALGLIVYADELINDGLNVHGGMSMMIGSIANARELLDKHK